MVFLNILFYNALDKLGKLKTYVAELRTLQPPPCSAFPSVRKRSRKIRDCEKHAHAVEYSLMKRKALSATTLMRGSRPRAFACIERSKAVRGEARKTKEENNNRIGHDSNRYKGPGTAPTTLELFQHPIRGKVRATVRACTKDKAPPSPNVQSQKVPHPGTRRCSRSCAARSQSRYLIKLI